MALHEVSTPETEMHDVQLFKNDLGLGITVAGYVCDEENISGIFVKDICRGSAADLTGNIQINDRIVKVNGKSVTALSNHQAIQVLKNSGPAVIISVERYLRGPKYERLQKNLCSNVPSPIHHDKEITSSVDLRTTTKVCVGTVNFIKRRKSPEHHLSIVLENIEEKGFLERDLSSSEQTLCNNLEFNRNDDVLELTTDNSEKTSDLNRRKMMPDNNFSFSSNFQEKEVKIRLVEDSTNYNNEYCGQLLSTTYNSERENSSYHLNKIEDESDRHSQLTIKSDNSVNSDSSCIYFSKASDDTEKDGYETCIDESLSDEFCTKSNVEATDEDRCSETPTPFNTDGSNIQVLAELNTQNNNNNNSSCQNIDFDESIDTVCLEPPEDYKSDNFVSTDDSLELSLYKDDNLQSYSLSDFVETDEFFLVGCLDSSTVVSDNELSKSLIESSVPESYAVPITTTYRCLRLKEYYNDYEDCLEEYNIFVKTPSKEPSPIIENSNNKAILYENKDILGDNICVPQILQFKSSSEPQIPLLFDELELCQDFEARRHSFLPNYEDTRESEDNTMTVTSKQMNFNLEKKCSTDKVFENHWGSTRSFQIHRESDESLGISIVCGKVDLHTPNANLGTTSGIFVKSVVPNSAAGKTGQFHTGDRILEVDGIDLTEAGHEEAVNAIRSATNPISFVVQSLIPLNTIYQTSEELAQDIQNEEENQIPEKGLLSQQIDLNQNHIDVSSYQDEKKMEREESEEEEEEEEEDNIYTARSGEKVFTEKGQKIDLSSAGNLRRSREEIAADVQQEDEYGYTNDKIKKRYANLGNTVMMVQLERGQQGLGLSLAGHKDRSCMAVFVCGLNPNGVAYKMGGIQIGDEILEVNGVVLHGRCHLNASAIIKGLAGPLFKIIILRRKTAVDDIAVRPVTQFPVSLEDESFEDRFSGYPSVRNIAIPKGNHSLGIMIIEGKHADLGQGIFISDIQDGSAAEKAGLEVGEMILAVNKDCLLGADYDTAANLLKRTEGLVSLYLSNPTKKPATPQPLVAEKADSEEPKAPTALKPQAPPSRSPTPVPEPVADLASCHIIPGKNSTIEILTDNRGIGLFFVGGKNTTYGEGVIVVEVFPGGTADKDGRIQAGDVILEANGVCLKESTSEVALQTFRQTLPKMKLVVLRPEKIEYTIIDVDLTKKPGKGLGLSVMGKKSGKGVYVIEVLNGGSADVDGRISKGDLLVSVNGQNVENVSADEAGAILKTVSGKPTLKFHRYKPIIR